jgi:hypothetical protein
MHPALLRPESGIPTAALDTPQRGVPLQSIEYVAVGPLAAYEDHAEVIGS